jgi:hypothetical protein
VANYAVNDAITGVPGRAAVGLGDVRSAHHNEARWLRHHESPNLEPALNTQARAWLSHVAANGSPAEQADINPHFPAPARATATSIQVEQSALPVPLRNQYFTTRFTLVAATRAQRCHVNCARYANQFRPGTTYIEFTVTGAEGMSRIVWDFVDDLFYGNTHYNWVDGFNPFFLITGTPAT